MPERNTPRYHAEPGAAAPAFTQVREMVLALRAEGDTDQAFDFLLSALAAVLRKSRELELLLAKARRVGRSSERMNPEQLALLFEELVEQLGGEPAAPDPQAEAEEDAQLDAEMASAAAEHKARAQDEAQPKRRRSAWRTSESVERREHTLEVPAEQRLCEHCGCAKQRIGEDSSPVLEFVPGHFIEHHYQREKWACRTCKRGVTTAPVPAKVIARSAADASLLAHVVVSKFVDHTPLHRLHRIYERTGVTIPVSTLADWTGEVADLVMPLVDRIAARILHQAYVARTDATGLRVLDSNTPENIQRGTVWALVGDDHDVVFRYTPTGEGASGPWHFLAGRKGYLQADAASVFDRLYNGQAASAVEVGCWAHARRKFVALQDTDCRVAYPIKLIARLYRLEHLADLKALDAEQRAAFRMDRSEPQLEKLQHWLLATGAQEPPGSELAKASAYVINQWAPLTRFLEDGRLSLDNNVCERQLRDIALGRNNYLFAGSHRAAHRAAALYSIMRTCAQYGVAPLPYLTDVLRKLAPGGSSEAINALLPDRWQASRAPP
ncbi:MAG: IS66 family transposase [Longimicrobiales bacterium]